MDFAAHSIGTGVDVWAPIYPLPACAAYVSFCRALDGCFLLRCSKPRRWNLAFVEMDRALFLKPLARKLGTRAAVFGVFIISGLFHEVAISFPVNHGWGMPLLY